MSALVLFRPYRVVTPCYASWHLISGRGETAVYASSWQGCGPWPLGELIERVGPVRPVTPGHPAEYARVRAALRDAGNQALCTLAWALQQTLLSVGSLALIAGRPGSWESRVLLALAQWGARVEASRVHHRAARAVHEQLLEWITAQQRYVEVAATLAGLFSAVADEWAEMGAAEYLVAPSDVLAVAWQSVADRRLWPDAYEGNSIGAEWYRYLMKDSRFFSAVWFDQWSVR